MGDPGRRVVGKGPCRRSVATKIVSDNSEVCGGPLGEQTILLVGGRIVAAATANNPDTVLYARITILIPA